MATIEEVRALIRFHLAELGTRDKHHEFEHLCRDFARNRICRNLLPATGPVSSGGDQGRDFESYRTYLNDCGLSARTIVGRTEQGPLVFACTVQTTGLGSKIKNDVRKIMKGAARPERVYFFSTVNINVAERHRIQEWATKEFSLGLDILDRQALSEQLSDLDLFWVAREHLDIPSEILPPLPDEPDGEQYESSKREWLSRQPDLNSFADFEELRQHLRHASRTPNLVGDVDLFSRKLATFAKSAIPSLRRRSTYEQAVASKHAFNDLRGLEQDLRNFFSDLASVQTESQRDTCNLLLYALGAWKRKVLDIDIAEWRSWRESLASILDRRIGTSTVANSEKCTCLELRGSVALMETAENGNPSNLGMDAAIAFWTAMIGPLDQAALYPLESFVNYLSDSVVMLGARPAYGDLTKRLDGLLAKRLGKRAAAESAHRRAGALREAGRIADAVEELHSSKVDWYAAETLALSALSMNEISRWYASVGLCFAAKYYALASAYITSRSPSPDAIALLPRTLLAAADCDYQAGAWANFILLTQIYLTHLSALSSANDESLDEDLDRLAFHCLTALRACELLDIRGATDMVRAVAASIASQQVQDDVMATARRALPDKSTLLAKTKEQLDGAPFSDLTNVRVIRWRALGIEWHVEFDNDFRTTLAAEEFVALLQILVADLSRVDLCLIPTRVHVVASVGQSDGSRFERKDTNEASQWLVTLPLHSGLSTRDEPLLAGCFQILREVSLASDDEFLSALRKRFAQGLSAKVFVARPYRDLVGAFLDEESFGRFSRREELAHAAGSSLVEKGRELPWNGTLRAEYSSDRSAEMIERRYKRALVPIKFTLARLGASAGFREAVDVLRSEGWKDSHVLAAVANLATNLRLQLDNKVPSEEGLKRFAEAMDHEETEDDAKLPESSFTVERLRAHANAVMMSSLKQIGLRSYQRTPDFEAIKAFMTRYRYFEDDVPHPPLIPSLSSPSEGFSEPV